MQRSRISLGAALALAVMAAQAVSAAPVGRHFLLEDDNKGAPEMVRFLSQAIELADGSKPTWVADLGPRLRELNAQVENLEQSIINLEEEPMGSLDAPEPDITEVTGMLRGLVEDCLDPKKLRTFFGSFIEKATVSGDSVAVFYNEGRMMSLGGSAVRSGNKWLLNLSSNQGPTD